MRQLVDVEPFRFANFKTAGSRPINRGACEVQFDLSRPFEGAREIELDIIYFQGNLFAQLASQSLIRLLVCVEKASGNSPATVGAELMLKQQNAAFVIEYQSPRSNGEASLPPAYRSEEHTSELQS